ncbi:unnamed protein product [Somion occarium]|uniref:DUF453-domain-containing protein n=1 Tax=Somion occarium TaxID=3059160 RepID=A0ABP1EAW7_9APHY
MLVFPRVGTGFTPQTLLKTCKRFSSRIHSASNPLPASFLRGGTSKGVFLNQADLPRDHAQWTPVFLGIMGSPDAEYGRQLNGMGGGVSSLSKICVVGRPSDEQKSRGIDVTYTFAQIGIRDSVVDYSGNCGNLSSMIGVFALDEGLCVPRINDDAQPLTTTIRSFNTNTNKIIDTTFPVSDTEGSVTALLDLPQSSIAGVPGKASQIILDFVKPGGARTVPVSLVDATNPTVFVTSEDLCDVLGLQKSASIDFTDSEVLETMEEIRKGGAIMMGLDPTAQAQPKFAALSAPSEGEIADGVDIVVRALSMGVPHKAVPMTVGLCLGVACNLAHTNAWYIVRKSRRGDSESRAGNPLITIKHPGGLVDVGAEISTDGEVLSAKVVRTGRRLMKGLVWW